MNMRVRCVLQLCLCLNGLSAARPAHPTHGLVPATQVDVLSRGLLHLLTGVEENDRYLETQGRQMSQELRRHARQLSQLRRRMGLVDKCWAEVRKELQVLAARGEGLQRGARKLQDLTNRDTMKHRLNRIQEIVQVLTAPGLAEDRPINITLLQTVMEAQSKRLAALTLEVMVQDGLVKQQDQRLAKLQVSDTKEEPQGFF
ncbi:hypothetical protein JZ751_012163 [Albula glossodonta]|uniref:Uncharacterized protein n=1 Tax=Albula glossodonta TaxID=121402 RepID=A0A8T2PRT4_9TELE|nr:hypothetical protein JZ751_012163 [Albula glossodonta]